MFDQAKRRAGMTPVRRSVSINLLAVLLSLTAVPQAVAEEPTKAPTFKPEELEQIVAPIALYPDAVLAQVFMASTYPLEIVQAARWSKEHPDVKGDALEKEMEKQSWDPSVKSLTTFPDVLTMMNEKLDWTQKLGDAFLAQQKDVMDAVQRLRAKAKAEGNLQGSKEQNVRTEAAPAGSSTSTIIYVEPADPQVVYVPTYNPTVVYGAWPYPAYPPYYYYPPGYVAATSFFSFTFGVAVGSALWGNCNWGHSDIDIDIDRQNNFNNINAGDRGDGNRGNQKWDHNSEHRKGAQYRDSATQQKYGKASDRQAQQSREQYRGRADEGRQQMAREGAGNQRDLSGQPIGSQSRDRASSMDSRDRGGASNRSTSSRSSSAFGGVGSGASTRASSSRGMSSRQSGGMSRSGGRRGR